MKHCRRRKVFDNRENPCPYWACGGVGGDGGGDWDGDGGGGGHACRQQVKHMVVVLMFLINVKKHGRIASVFSKC